MHDIYYTRTGERPDLASLTINLPEGFIGRKILPIVPITEKTGRAYYRTIAADEAADTSRSVGAAPSSEQISQSVAAITTAEVCKRGYIAPDEVKLMGGIENADRVGAMWAMRQVENYLEGAIITETIGGTVDATFDSAKFLSQAQTALDTIRGYEGKISLFGATAVLKKVVQALLADKTYGPVFSRLIAGGSPAQAATGMNFKAWMNGLAMFLGVDEVLGGDSALWNSATYATSAGRFGIAVIPDASDPMSHKWKPELGKCFQFMPDGKLPYVVQSVADRVAINNAYDAFCWFDLITFNGTALYVFDGVL